MRTIPASKARATLQSYDEPVLIKGNRANVVLVSEDAWRGIEETLYLISIPGMRESILEGGETPIVECGESAPHPASKTKRPPGNRRPSRF